MKKNDSLKRFDNRMRGIAPALLAGLTVALAGCGDSTIQTYQVAKEDNQPPSLPSQGGTPAAPRGGLPHVHSDVPAGWQELPPEKMRVASYKISGGNGQTATVSVTPLPGASEIELQSVNMWREQELGLAPLSADQFKTQGQPVAVGDAKGVLVDMQSETAAGGRILGALAERGGITWVIKMAGAPALVEQQKQNFVSYLKSLDIHDSPHGQPSQAVASAEKPVSTNTEKLPANSDAPNFKVPANWTEKAAPPMVTSAYTITGENGQGEVTISKFPGSVGGMVANINRWRGQLGLAPQPEVEVRNGTEMIEVAGKKDSYLVDIKGTRAGKETRLVAVGVPHGDQTWFFKLMGDEALVAKEKDAFVRFIISAY